MDTETETPEADVAAVAEFIPTPHGIHARVAARELLASTDPALLDALEAALVRAGRLSVEECCDHARQELRDFGGTRIVMCGEYGGGETCRTRVRSEWRS